MKSSVHMTLLGYVGLHEEKPELEERVLLSRHIEGNVKHKTRDHYLAELFDAGYLEGQPVDFDGHEYMALELSQKGRIELGSTEYTH